MLLEIFLALFVLCVAFLIYASRNLNVWRGQGVKGPQSLPFFGNSIDNMVKHLHIVETERYKKYGPIYGYLDFMKPFLTVGDPDLIKQIAIKDFHLFRNHIPLLPGDPIFSKALGFVEDDDWKRLRSILSPAFSNAKIKQMFPMMNECVVNTLKHLQKLADNKNEFDLSKVCTAHSIDTITRCAYGIKTNAHENPNDPILVNANKFAEFPLWRVILTRFLPQKIQKLFGIQLVDESVLKFFGNVIEHIAAERKGNEDKYHDFLQTMLDSRDSRSKNGSIEKTSKAMETVEIMAQFPEFLIGGFEPASNILMYSLYSLAVNADKQEKLYLELLNKAENENFNYDRINEMDYLDAVINETLRLYGPFINTDRVASKDYKLGDTGIIVPKGAVINIPLFAIHHDPKYHPEPYTFKPERFLPENRNKIEPQTFMPFGVGPRICVAMNFAIIELKLALANIIMRFKFNTTANTDVPAKHKSSKYFYHCEPLYVAVEKRH